MNVHVIRAIFKRNFVSYFANPTGYVFICVFVFLSSVAAFMPYDFFNANLANLDQLNRYLPYIMLVFIPAITMSIWAEERRQGTDELLLTIPAADFDVVLGKYLAAVAIFSVSLIFSMICNYLVLWRLGDPDFGLLMGTYFGYWIVGLAMLATGMVASFMTSNLTVGFILGALFNAPLVFAGALSDRWSFLKQLSITAQFHDFSRGVISFAAIGYFLAIVALMLYLCIVLLGRRHWKGGAEGSTIAGHYLVRFLALVAAVVALNVFLTNHDTLRADVTSEKLNSLSAQSRELISTLSAERPVVVEYFVSPNVPESYVQTRLNLLNTLREFQALGGDRLRVIGHDVQPFTEEATRAEQQFGIRPVAVEWRNRGATTRDEIFMGMAFTCGLDKVVIPFLDKGIPAEYEIVRSIATVSQQKRKKLGVLMTDAKLYATFDMQTMSPGRNEQIIEELQKQYDVVQVDAANPITEHYDVLLAVQPSSLAPDQMDNFIAAVKAGQPTAIFEDPFPWLSPEVPGTMAPRQAPGGNNPFMQQRTPPQPKGDITKLWQLLGVDVPGDTVIWQDYNPYPKFGAIPHEWVFIDAGCGAKQPFNLDSPITKRLQQLLFLYPGAVQGLNSSQLQYHELVSTGERTGTIRADQLIERSMMGQPRMNPEVPFLEKPTKDKYTLAARITGKPKADPMKMSDKKAGAEDGDEAGDDAAKADEDTAAPADKNTEAKADEDAKAEPAADKPEGHAPDDNAPAGDKPAESEAKDAAAGGKPATDGAAATKLAGTGEINVVLVTDIDCLYSAFFALRARGDDPEQELSFQFDNVPFVLNLLDVLSGDERFVEIRTRRPSHRTLTKVTEATESSRKQAEKAREDFVRNFEKERAKVQKKFDDEMAAINARGNANRQQATIEKLQAQMRGQQELDVALQRLKDKQNEDIKKSQNALQASVSRVQDEYKLWAVLLPPIPPLIVALIVFFNRRAGEREGVSKARLR